MFYETILIALREISRNRVRSLLTTLGIVIGVASVIGMVSLGEGATRSVTADIAALGQNMLVLTPGAERHGPGRASVLAEPFEQDDADALAAQVSGIERLAPAASRQALAVAGSKNYRTLLIGTTPDYFDITGHALGAGRWMNAAEIAGGRPVCVIGRTASAELFGAGDPIGAIVRVAGVSCTIVGLLAPKGTSTFQDPNDVIVMPLATIQRRIIGSRDVSSIYISTRPQHSSALVKRQIELLMHERRRLGAEDAADYTVRDMQEIIAAVSSATGTMTALLGGIAAVSLLVGGIGIMNIMLVSVTERTREIGIRLAIGARTRDVLLQFLMEAVVLSTLGGVFGICFGIALGYAGTRITNLPFGVSPHVVALAFAFSAAVGVVFGLLPARKAALLNPIDALRHE